MNRRIALLLLGALFMLAVIVYGFTVGSFFDEAALLFPSPWFQVTLIDLYLGFALFACWIFSRESNRGVAVIWIIALCLLGNLAACVYAAKALKQAHGNRHTFWFGSA